VWNLKNKMNKQRKKEKKRDKQKSRPLPTENKLVVARVGGMGKIGEGD